jgi:hypothetical protein
MSSLVAMVLGLLMGAPKCQTGSSEQREGDVRDARSVSSPGAGKGDARDGGAGGQRLVLQGDLRDAAADALSGDLDAGAPPQPTDVRAPGDTGAIPPADLYQGGDIDGDGDVDIYVYRPGEQGPPPGQLIVTGIDEAVIAAQQPTAAEGDDDQEDQAEQVAGEELPDGGTPR